jgi:hypothetical protein
VIHPSSTTLFLLEELTGERPEGIWVCGLILPKGACVNGESQRVLNKLEDAGQFPFSWVLERGVFKTGIPLISLLNRMGIGDVYVKGVNAIDPQGRVGSLYAKAGAGTIGKVIAASRRKGFMIVIPVGFEKLIPTPIPTAAKMASRDKTKMAMGIPLGLIPVPGKVLTEVGAIHILSGAEASVVAAGGLGGAEGALTLVIRDSEEKVKKALKIVKDLKGVALPEIFPQDCRSCTHPVCHLRGNEFLYQ